MIRDSQSEIRGNTVGICRVVRKQGSLRKGQDYDREAEGWEFCGMEIKR